MATESKSVRQSVTLPANLAKQVSVLARRRRLSSNRILVELVEEGLVAQQQKEKAFFQLARQFRNAKDPKEAEELGERLGRMVFGK